MKKESSNAEAWRNYGSYKVSSEAQKIANLNLKLFIIIIAIIKKQTQRPTTEPLPHLFQVLFLRINFTNLLLGVQCAADARAQNSGKQLNIIIFVIIIIIMVFFFNNFFTLYNVIHIITRELFSRDEPQIHDILLFNGINVCSKWLFLLHFPVGFSEITEIFNANVKRKI